MDTIWRFDGSGGCEKCGAATGDYPSNPGRPHPYCDCSLTEITIDEICMEIDKWTIEMVLDTMTFDLGPGEHGPGEHPNTRRVTECENILSITDRKWKCCKVENGKVTDDCYEKITTKEEHILRCSEPYEVPVEETPIFC